MCSESIKNKSRFDKKKTMKYSQKAHQKRNLQLAFFCQESLPKQGWTR
jgi:hypothetical protein